MLHPLYLPRRVSRIGLELVSLRIRVICETASCDSLHERLDLVAAPAMPAFLPPWFVVIRALTLGLWAMPNSTSRCPECRGNFGRGEEFLVEVDGSEGGEGTWENRLDPRV